MKHKDSVARLQIELQAASRGWFNWEDILIMDSVFPYFGEMYFQYNGSSVEELKYRMCEQGYKLSYKSYIEMFIDFTEQFRYSDTRLRQDMMFG